jgi:hypothetical protein
MRLRFGTGCLSGEKTPSLARLASQPRQSSRMAFFFFFFFFVQCCLPSAKRPDVQFTALLSIDQSFDLSLTPNSLNPDLILLVSFSHTFHPFPPSLLLTTSKPSSPT